MTIIAHAQKIHYKTSFVKLVNKQNRACRLNTKIAHLIDNSENDWVERRGCKHLRMEVWKSSYHGQSLRLHLPENEWKENHVISISMMFSAQEEWFEKGQGEGGDLQTCFASKLMWFSTFLYKSNLVWVAGEFVVGKTQQVPTLCHKQHSQHHSDFVGIRAY